MPFPNSNADNIYIYLFLRADLDDFFHNLFPAKDNHFTFFVLPHESPEPGSMDAFIGKYLHCLLYNNNGKKSGLSHTSGSHARQIATI